MTSPNGGDGVIRALNLFSFTKFSVSPKDARALTALVVKVSKNRCASKSNCSAAVARKRRVKATATKGAWPRPEGRISGNRSVRAAPVFRSPNARADGREKKMKIPLRVGWRRAPWGRQSAAHCRRKPPYRRNNGRKGSVKGVTMDEREALKAF